MQGTVALKIIGRGECNMYEREKELYLEKDFNCAETIMIASNERYDLKLSADAFKLFSAYGGGMCSKETCGALLAALAVMGYKSVGDRAHATEGFAAKCADFVEEFKKRAGCIKCEQLMEKYKTPEERCIKTVIIASELLKEKLN